MRASQCHVHLQLEPLLARKGSGEIDRTVVVSHRRALEETPRADELFKREKDGALEIVRSAA